MNQPAREFLRNAVAIAAMTAAGALGVSSAAVAQISVDATLLATGYTQNFDSLGTTQLATLPTGWKFTAAGQGTAAGWGTATNVAATTQQASSGAPATGGIYNWGSSTTDRAPGFMTSGSYASPNGLLFGLTNTTGSTITGLMLAFDYERYRVNSAAASVSFLTSTDGSTWTAVSAGDSGAFATGASTYTFANGTVVNKSGISLSNLSIAQNQSYYFKWNFNTTGSSSQGIGLDNFQATFTSSGGGGGNAPLHWVGSDTTLGGDGPWSQTGGTSWRTTDTDGAGEAWDPTKIATFGGTAGGTVTVTDTVNANAGLSFSTTGYTLTGGTISLGGANLAANTIATGATTATAITSVIAGSTGLTKAGPGTLTLGGANTYSGGTTVSAGTLVGTTTSLQGDITNNAAVTFDQGADGTYGSVLTGSGSLTKTGPGVLTLSGTNTFTGPVTIANGVLSVGSQANLGGGSSVTLNGGTLRITGAYSSTSGATQVFNVGAAGGTVEVAEGVTAQKRGDQLLGPGNTLTKTGAGTLALTSSGTSTVGTLAINGGFFQITSGRIGSVAAVNVGSGGTFWIGDTLLTNLTLAAGATLSFAGDGQDGSGAFRHTLDEAGNAALTIPQSISLPSTARFTLVNRGSETVTDTFSGAISGSGGLIKDGAGTMVLSGVNTYAGGTTVSAGTLSVSADANLGNAAGGIALGGGRLEMASGFTLGSARTITAAAGSSSSILVTTGTVSFAGAFVGSGNLDKAGVGRLSVGNASSGYTGTFTISAGTLEITAANAFANATLSQTGGTLLLAPQGGGDALIPDLGGSGGVVTIDTGANGVFGGNSNRGYDGRIRGQGAFKKEGNGTLTLNADNDFAGNTRIAQGRLKLGASGTLSATPRIDINSGAIFDVADKSGFALGTGQRLGGKGTVLGSLEFGSGSQFAFDPTGPLLVGSGTVSFAAGFGIGSIFGLDATVAEGTYTLLNETTGGSISFANLANVGPGSPFDLGGGKAAYFQQGSLQVVVVPEPDTFFIGGLGLALAGLATCRHRRRRSCPAA